MSAERGPSGTGHDTPRPEMMRDEAIEWLLARLEGDPRAELTISVEHGNFQATYTDVTPTQGDWHPHLADALTSLIGYFHGR